MNVFLAYTEPVVNGKYRKACRDHIHSSSETRISVLNIDDRSKTYIKIGALGNNPQPYMKDENYGMRDIY